MSCAVFTFIGLYGLILQKSNGWIVGASFSAAGVLFLVATFLAWNDEHNARIKAESDVLTPKIDLGWGPTGSQQKHLTIENSGTVDLQIQDVSLPQTSKAHLIKSHVYAERTILDTNASQGRQSIKTWKELIGKDYRISPLIQPLLYRPCSYRNLSLILLDSDKRARRFRRLPAASGATREQSRCGRLFWR